MNDASGLDLSPAIGELGSHRSAVEQVISRARSEVPLYRDVHEGVASLELADQPSFTKSDLEGYGPLPLSALPLSDMWRVCATSGTTGPRLFVGYTESDWAAVRDQYGLLGSLMGIDSSDVLMNSLGGGLWVGAPSLDELAHARGCGLIPSGPTNAEQMLGWLSDFPITLLSATPSYMRVLVETAERDNVDLMSLPLRMGLLGGEGSPPGLRRHVVDAFGGQFHWQELYGSTETGGPILGIGTPEDQFSAMLEINTSYFVVELLHPDRDEPVEEGQEGEITITTPYRQGSPLIRYRTRDLATAVAERGASGLPRITTLRGRIDDALKVRGALVYPSVIDGIVVDTLVPGAEWRIHLGRKKAGHDVMTLIVETDDDHFDEDNLGEHIRRRTQVRPRIDQVPMGTLERFSAKASRVLDDRPSDEQ